MLLTPYNSIEPLVPKGVPMALKIVYQICCGIDVHKTFVVACISSTNKQGVTTYKRHRFSTFTQGLKELLQWLLDNHCKDVWNLLVNTGFLSTMFWKTIVRLSLLIPNTLRLSVERKLTRKMRNGLLTCLSMTLLPVALCLLLISDSFVTLCAIATN